MNNLNDKKILIGVSGSIAAYKTLELIRLLIKASAQVKVAMTDAAAKLIAPLTFETISCNPVYDDVFNRERAWETEHIELALWGDLYAVVPATANIIGKCANGIADDAPTTLYAAFDKKALLAPAMNHRMYASPAVTRNIAQLRADGVEIVEPDIGELACGETGWGRLAQVEEIFQRISAALLPQDLAGLRILINAGPTREFIDPVRFIAARSSGKMGIALARAARSRGADVRLVCSRTVSPPAQGLAVLHAESAHEMRDVMLREASSADVILLAAAVADFTPEAAAAQKIKKSPDGLSLKLKTTPDIAAELSAQVANAVIVGFAAETENVIANATEKLRRKNFTLIVANDVSRSDIGFEADQNEVTIIDGTSSPETLPKADKREIAHQILHRVAQTVKKH